MSVISMRCFCAFVSCIIALFSSGCSGGPYESSHTGRQADRESRFRDYKVTEGSRYSKHEATVIETSLPETQQLNRKIIFNGTVNLVVENFDPVDQQVVDLVKEYQGFVIESSVQSRTADRREGSWKVKIPSENFGRFFAAVQDLGIPEIANKTSEDVTEEFLDLDARIKSKRAMESRVLTLLENKEHDLAQVIKLENELERIRSDIERMQGRLKYLSNRVELATIDINCREVKNYVPPQTPEFSSAVTSSWSDSVESVTTTGEGLVIWFVGIVPWLILWIPELVIGWIVLWVIRRILSKRRSTTVAPTG